MKTNKKDFTLDEIAFAVCGGGIVISVVIGLITMGIDAIL